MQCLTLMPGVAKLPAMRQFAPTIALLLLACGDSSTLVANLPPQAFAGFDVVAAVGSTVTLDGSMSHDPDGNGLSYSWRILRGGEGASLSQTSGAQTDLVGGQEFEGSVVVELLTHDGAESSEPDWVTVRFVTPANLARPVADAGANRHITSGDPLVLGGAASTGNIDGYRWLHLASADGEIRDIDSGATALVTELGDGLHVFGLLVRSGELWSVMDCVSVIVASDPPDEAFPTVSIVSQSTGSVTLESSVNDVTWSLVSGPGGASAELAGDNGQPNRLSFVADEAGLHLFAATNDEGLSDWLAVELETAP